MARYPSRSMRGSSYDPRFKKRLLLMMFVFLNICFFYYQLSPIIQFGWNRTESLDGYLYMIIKGQKPKVGDLFAFQSASDPFFPGKTLIKYAAGAGGDHVAVEQLSYYINGRYMGDAKTHAKDGTRLTFLSEQVIPTGHYFAWTPHEDSYDSRYNTLGLVSSEQVLGRAVKVF